MQKLKIRLTKTVALHYVKLIFRSVLLIATLIAYISDRINGIENKLSDINELHILPIIVWFAFIIGMILRFFPARLESMGCQKQFGRNYIEIAGCNKTVPVQSGVTTFAVVSAWVALNAIIGVLYYTHIIDEVILLLICLVYSVCDIVCILFFCPFQTWIMKNKCCATCRIYNWDYAMMFTPFVYIPNIYTVTLLGTALALLIKWEIIYKKYPERFSEGCNKSLSCAMCKEKLCHHKKQLRVFLQKERFNLSGNSIVKSIKDIKAKKNTDEQNTKNKID